MAGEAWVVEVPGNNAIGLLVHMEADREGELEAGFDHKPQGLPSLHPFSFSRSHLLEVPNPPLKSTVS